MTKENELSPEIPRDEERFVERLQAGDDEAFTELVSRFTGQLLAVARRLLGNNEDARDAVQDAFLASFRALGKFDGRAHLSTWLHRIVINAALMKLRARKRKNESSIDDMLPKFHQDGHRVAPGPQWRDSALEELDRCEIRDLVQEKIRHLPDPYRTVLLLRDIEQLDTETTSRILGEPCNVVRVRLHRARQALRASLDPIFRSIA